MAKKPLTDRQRAALKPYTPGDPRLKTLVERWTTTGVHPRHTWTILRKLAQEIAREITTGEDGQTCTVAEGILRRLANHPDPRYQIEFLEFAFGRPPQAVSEDEAGQKQVEVLVTYQKNWE